MINLTSFELNYYDKFNTHNIGKNSIIYNDGDKLLKIIDENVLKNNSNIESNIDYFLNFYNKNISFPTNKVYVDGTFKGYEMDLLKGYNLIRKIEKSVRDLVIFH